MGKRLWGIGLAVLLQGFAVVAQEGAPELVTGGLWLFQSVPAVSIAKERLYISQQLVRADYECVNESDQEILGDVVYLVPDYGIAEGGRALADLVFTVDWKDLSIPREVRAYLGDRDVTPVLRACSIDFERFGLWQPGNPYQRRPAQSQMSQLPRRKLEDLVEQGLVKAAEGDGDPYAFLPQWKLRARYRWSQVFPPGKRIRISHAHRPVLGFVPGAMAPEIQNPLRSYPFYATVEGGCPSEAFRRELDQWKRLRVQAKLPKLRTEWVTYALTFSRGWKPPIGDFELVVERNPGEMTTFCWDTPIQQVGPDLFQAKATQFTPKADLTVYFVKPSN